MKKIALIAIALVVALGGLGIGYAAWTDEVTISGTVNTGSLDIEVVNQSNTWVWKDLVTEEAIVLHQYEFDPDNGFPPTPSSILIAKADADCPVGTPPTPDDTVVIVFNNIFPDINFVGDFLIHYSGSIPAKVTLGAITCSNAALAPYFVAKFYEATWNPQTPAVPPVKGLEITGAIQMHFCDYVLVEVTLNIPEVDALMNQSGTISGTISAIQWNEYVGP